MLIFGTLVRGMEQSSEHDSSKKDWDSLYKKVRNEKIIKDTRVFKSLKLLVLKKLILSTSQIDNLPEELKKSIECARQALILLNEPDDAPKELLIEFIHVPYVLEIIGELQHEKLLLDLAKLPEETFGLTSLPPELLEEVKQVRLLSASTVETWQERLKEGDIYFVEKIENSTQYPAIVSLLVTNSALSSYQRAFLVEDLVNLSAMRGHSATVHFLQTIRAPELNVLGCRPLYWSVLHGHLNLVSSLLQDPLARFELDRSRNTLLNVAQERGHTAIADLLRQSEDSLHEERSVSASQNNDKYLGLPTHNWQDLFSSFSSIM